MDKAVFLQNQIRENAQDLHSFMSDLKNWETEMKRKEAELSGVPREQDLPPVRSKAKKSKSVKKVSQKPPKRIAGYDYSSWDRFDADKACEAVDEVGIGPPSQDSKMSEEDKKIMLREEAQQEKEKGNQFVKNLKWDEAISCYNRAIELYQDDAIYYANRGLCHLKKENLHAAESDCTKALELDPTYVKALQRRSCAREALGSLRRAAADLRKILELEPENVTITKQLMAVTQRMGTKGPNSKSSPATTPSSDDASESSLVETGTKATGKAQNNVDVGDDAVQAILKPPHLRSKKPLVRIPITEIPLGSSNESMTKTFLDGMVGDTKLAIDSNGVTREKLEDHLNGNQRPIIEEINMNEKPPEVPTMMAKDKKQNTKEVNKPVENGNINVESVEIGHLQLEDLRNVKFQVPKSSVQFISNWRLLRGRDRERSQYLKAITPDDIPSIFQNFLESDILSDILETLNTGVDFTGSNTISTLPYLECLTRTKRFGALAMFLSDKDKMVLLSILQRCKETAKCSDNIIEQIKNKYEV